MSLSQKYSYPIHKLVMLMDHVADQLLQSHSQITYSQFTVMFAVNVLKHPSQREIANFLGKTEAAISRQVENLSKMNFIIRSNAHNNRRINILELNRDGKTKLDGANEMLRKHMDSVYNVLDSQEQEIFRAAIVKLTAAVEAFQNQALKQE